MRNYTFDDYESDKFICGYIIKNNEIIIKYGSLDEQVIPYTIQNEKRILNVMKNQIKDRKNINDFKENQNLYLSKCKDKILKCFSSGLLTILLLMAGMNNLTILIQAISIFLFTNGFIYTYGYIDGKNELRDLEKNELYIENEELLEPLYNINEIDSLSFKQVNNLIKQNNNKEKVKCKYKKNNFKK